MIPRLLEKKLQEVAKGFPAIALMGPRQSGKTTLARATFPHLPYVSMENLDIRGAAKRDPRGFLEQYSKGAILDEIQLSPELFSYLQGVLDDSSERGRFVLTGSQNFLLYEKITQSLAGRIALLELLPFSYEEVRGIGPASLEEVLYKGLYPPLYDELVSPEQWYPSYIRTYIERDVRLIKNITDLSSFEHFLKICAAQVGQLLNLSAISVELGVSHSTVKAWLSVLESSYIIFFLRPHFPNFRKRLVKMPKLYFWDTGLICSLLGVQKPSDLSTHYLKGALFENFVVEELAKQSIHRGLRPSLSFWRDHAGREIDCILTRGTEEIPIEIKSGKTFQESFTQGLQFWTELLRNNKLRTSGDGFLIYGGVLEQNHGPVHVVPWNQMPIL